MPIEQRFAPLGQFDADALAARIAQRDRAAVVGRACRDHVHEFGFVGRRHHHHVRQAGEVGDVEGAGVGRAVRADQARAVDREAHGQVLDRNVVHHLVVGALQEGRIDRAEGLQTFGREPGGEGHRVLFGDADVEDALGKELLHPVDAGPLGHGGGDRDDLFVATRRLQQRVAEHFGVGGGVGLGLGLRAGDDVEGRDAVIFVVGRLGRRIAVALLGHDMDQHRPAVHVAHVLEDGQQMVEIVAVDRSDVVEAQLLEQRAAGEEAAPVFLGALGLVVEESSADGGASCLATSRSDR